MNDDSDKYNLATVGNGGFRFLWLEKECFEAIECERRMKSDPPPMQEFFEVKATRSSPPLISQRIETIRLNRRRLCECGSGKRYKNCCERRSGEKGGVK